MVVLKGSGFKGGVFKGEGGGFKGEGVVGGVGGGWGVGKVR